jgi:hypothetical protein
MRPLLYILAFAAAAALLMGLFWLLFFRTPRGDD